ncbi:MAG TPA: ion channel [Bacteroidia bacterium]|nr:ion channel [Bacteroidia bacterium]
MKVLKNKTGEERELGFGTKNYGNRVRFLDNDGRVNVHRAGMGIKNLDIYHWLITTSKLNLVLVIILSYTIVNLVFACVYYLIGPGYFGGLDADKAGQQFLNLFFFSAQTITTLGYGHIYPIGNSASIAASVESLLGLLTFALATGVLYGRFSRPRAHLLYSKNMLIAPFKGGSAFMFRIANRKQYELIESEASVTITLNNPETKRRDFFNLKLEINRVNFLALSWTIVHPVDDESPLYGLSKKDLEERDVEFIILIKAINDTYSQTVYSRNSYKAEEIIEQAKFKPLSPEANKRGRVHLVVTDIHLYETLG